MVLDAFFADRDYETLGAAKQNHYNIGAAVDALTSEKLRFISRPQYLEPPV